MNCELKIEIVPRAGTSPQKTIWDKLLPLALKHPWLKGATSTSNKRAYRLAYVASELFKSESVRQKLKLNERIH